jgi:hypothetical protein
LMSGPPICLSWAPTPERETCGHCLCGARGHAVLQSSPRKHLPASSSMLATQEWLKLKPWNMAPDVHQVGKKMVYFGGVSYLQHELTPHRKSIAQPHVGQHRA